jgi:hypothetical protein
MSSEEFDQLCIAPLRADARCLGRFIPVDARTIGCHRGDPNVPELLAGSRNRGLVATGSA